MFSNAFNVKALFSCVLVVILASLVPRLEAGHLRTKRRNTMEGGLTSIRQVVGPFGKFEITTRGLVVDDEEDKLNVEDELGDVLSLSYDMSYVYSLSMSMPEVPLHSEAPMSGEVLTAEEP